MIIYAGDTDDVVNRILTNHSAGNVEGSALRKHVAQAHGFRLHRQRRPSGSTKLRIDLPDPKAGERAVTSYIRSGTWRYVLCRDYAEAHDFQYYVIDQLQPLMNIDRKPWDSEKRDRYSDLLAKLLAQAPATYTQLRGQPTGPGVYVLEHSSPPGKVAA